MERLWRPWRMSYIKGAERHAGCFLCDAVSASPDRDEELLVVARGKTAFAILNAFPYNTGHLMVAPNRHIGDLDELSDEEADEILSLTKRCVAAHRGASGPDGFNIGINLGVAAGAGVPGHLHQHVVPRWSGDTNFMPVIADAKVLPEMLKETYEQLKPLLS